MRRRLPRDFTRMDREVTRVLRESTLATKRKRNEHGNASCTLPKKPKIQNMGGWRFCLPSSSDMEDEAPPSICMTVVESMDREHGSLKKVWSPLWLPTLIPEVVDHPIPSELVSDCYPAMMTTQG
ncbi:unnamed protein product [Linum trigynum]|uniref:Uncharacterized protein n=1 Tax=Linum trigynum TaxID=586398 RepID=A0AAV2CWS3_9ROSI